MGQLEPPQNFQCRDCRLAIEPGADLILYLVEHRGPFRNRLAAAVRAAMRRPPFAVAPCRPKAGGKAIEIDNDQRRRHRLYPPAIDPFPELALSRADLCEQHYRIGSGAELPQPVLGFVCDLRMRQHPIHWWRRRVVALDDPSTDALLLFELEGR